MGSLNRGGAETLVLDALRHSEYSESDRIIVYRKDGDLTDAYRDTDVPMFRIDLSSGKLSYIKKLRHFLQSEKVNVLHTQTHLNAFLGVLITAFTGIKLVVTYHGFTPSLTDRIFTKFAVWFADASVFVSSYLRDWYVKRTPFAPKSRCHVIYNGVDFSKLCVKYPAPGFLQAENAGQKKGIDMVMVGNFSSGRSQLFLCQALKALKDNYDCQSRFFFIGKKSNAEPEVYDDCVDFCRKNGLLDEYVFFPGGRSDVPAILQHVDAFVYSTNRDTFGIAVIEAIAAGLPTLVNDWAVMKEVTDNGELATLFRTRDIDDCASKMAELIRNIDARKLKAKELAKTVRQRFSIENHIRNLDAVYKSVLAK